MNNSTLAGNELRFTSCNKTKLLFAKAFCLLLLTVFFQLNIKAQSPPSCNLSGQLQGQIRGGNIVINVQVANSTANPTLDYAIKNNGTNASILNKGSVVFDAATNSSTQQVTVNPGTTIGGVNLQLVVTTANGTCQCSKSVSITY